jgi:hypothetical protein
MSLLLLQWLVTVSQMTVAVSTPCIYVGSAFQAADTAALVQCPSAMSTLFSLFSKNSHTQMYVMHSSQ